MHLILTHHKHRHNINFTYTIPMHHKQIQHKIHIHNRDVTSLYPSEIVKTSNLTISTL